MKKMLIAPSILSCDYGKMAEELERIERCGADIVHVDVMDGHFVPNITLGAPVVKCIRKYSSLPFDVHLMITDPADYVEDFINAGADSITIHLECDSDIDKTLSLIKEKGCKAAVSVKPKTPAEAVFDYLDKVSMVLVMTVEPGFGGQSFMEDMMPKVEAIKKEIDRRGLDVSIQVDGGIGEKTIEKAAKSGADIFVSGNALFKAEDMTAQIELFKSLAEKSYCGK
jgi:ribulose-phosphate 3-epimerase